MSARMTDEEIAEFLTEQGVGLLALADGGDAYAIPISFGYDGERAVFSYWHFGTETAKEEYTEATRRACLAVYDVHSPVKWRSVLAFGELEEIPPGRWDELGELIDDNAWSPDVSPIGNRGPTITGYEMEIEEVSGFQGSAYE
ncbi:pyridoxamine 5'-phosphate oxidase family protein [Natrialbaceae archaeon A-gly3]